MRLVASAVLDDVLVVATSVEQGIGKYIHAGRVKGASRHLAFFVDGLGKVGNGAVVPTQDGGGDVGGAKGIAKGVTE